MKILILFSIISIFSTCSEASQLVWKLGGNFSQVTVPSATGSGQAIYRGPGILADLRFRWMPDLFGMGSTSDVFSLDFFGTSGMDFTSNTAANLDESYKKMNFGGGVDLCITFVYFGVQYLKNKATISSVGQSADLNYGSFGGRFGFNIGLNDKKSAILTVGGVYELGSATLPSGGQRLINQMTFNVLVGYNLMSLFSSSTGF